MPGGVGFKAPEQIAGGEMMAMSPAGTNVAISVFSKPLPTLRRPALSRSVEHAGSLNQKGSLSARGPSRRETMMTTHVVEGWTGSVAAALSATHKKVPTEQQMPIRDPDAFQEVFDGDTCTYSKRLLPRGRAFSLGERPRTIVETPEPCNRWPMPPTDYNWRSHAQPGIVPGAPGSRRAGVAQGTWYAATLVKMAPRGWPSPGGGHMQYEPARFNRTPRDARPARPFTHASVRAANAHYLKGLQWLERDFPFRGEAELERALGADPNHVAAMGLLAKLKLKLRSDYNGAARLFEKALALDEGNAMALAGLAQLEECIRFDFDKAEALYKRAAAADPSDASIFANFALFYKHCRKDPVRCRDMMLTAYGIQPDRPWFKANAARFDGFDEDTRRTGKRGKA